MCSVFFLHSSAHFFVLSVFSKHLYLAVAVNTKIGSGFNLDDMQTV